ncbi:MAG: tetratricopeptide repeat protein [Succinivibrionaceae bacterium]
MKIKLFLSVAMCLSLSNTTFANDDDLCVTKFIAGLYTEAIPYCEKSCNLDEGSGCDKLGVLYAKGQGVKQDKKIAKEYFGKACDLGEQNGCNKYRELNEQGY